MKTLQETLATRVDIQNEDIEKIIERALRLQEETHQKAGDLSPSDVKDIASDLQIDPRLIEVAISQLKEERQEQRAKEAKEEQERKTQQAAQAQQRQRLLWSIGGGTIALLVLLLVMALSGRDELNGAHLEATQARERLENVLTRHADLAPQQLGLAGGELSVVSSLATALRNEKSIEQKLARFAELNTALGTALAALPPATTTEAIQQRQELRFQLEGAQNRVSTERGRYTEVVAAWQSIAQGSISAKLAIAFGFASDEKP
jgi:LemA protein